ncbi:phosphoribosylglycinamide formyltransferase 2 [Synechocystis sp. B12]|nr:phosphoribosylglycinamide formyltransferase 2 [Synechocystis sp. B12]
MANPVTLPQTFLLLGSGELGKEFTIAAQRLGNRVIAVDRYSDAPAMQVAQVAEVISMLDGDALEAVVKKYQPDWIVPEVEAIRTEKLLELEAQGYRVIPTAQATNLTMNRDRIRELAAQQLGVRTARYDYATSLAELEQVSQAIGFPNVVKPVMSSSGKGQSVVNNADEVAQAWQGAIAGARGDQTKVIVEEFIPFELEITLLTIRQWQGETLFCDPIGHRQERGDYQESWQPAPLTQRQLAQAQAIAKTVTDALGGGYFWSGIFHYPGGSDFFRIVPRPHDTGMVTLISQNLNEFELHLRAILGLPIPQIKQTGPAASAVILALEAGEKLSYAGLVEALTESGTDVRLFGKPNARPHRRLGVALAQGESVDQARRLAQTVVEKVIVQTE